MKANAYLKRFLPIAAVLIVGHIAFVSSGIIPGNTRLAVITGVVLLFIFAIGTPIVLKGLASKEKESFVGSFLILTTIQMLSVMAVLAAFVVTKVPGFREVSLQFVSVFVLILIVQSYFLIKIVNNPKK